MTLRRKLYYLLHNGKNNHLTYFARAYLRESVPAWLFRCRLERLLGEIERRSDRDYIHRRADYYCKIGIDTPIDPTAWREHSCEIGRQPMLKQKTYFFDAVEYARYFDSHLRWAILPGDVTFLTPVPTILKCRPLRDDNASSVILNLDKVRHFLFVSDSKPWREKRDVAIFRGDLGPVKPNRDVFMGMFGNGQSAMVDAASTNIIDGHEEWHSGKMTIGEHLDYKFVMSLEGNDVASNLKWVMSSNSIAVTPRLTRETWFMEGTLVPNYHYIEVKPDFSDLEERLRYYISHPDEAEAIISHAHEYVRQFQDKHREKLIALLVLKKYFDSTNRKQ